MGSSSPGYSDKFLMGLLSFLKGSASIIYLL
jgi:hypothetical protein